MKNPLIFASNCPSCRHQRSQCGYTRHALIRSIATGQMIEAYCLECDLLWPVSTENRVLIAWAIAIEQ